jgi:hypothetical protein
MVASKMVTIKVVDPIMVFYENSPLYGIVYEKSINNGFNLEGQEVSIVASPFYFNINDNINYNWSINNKSEPNIKGLSVTFRKPGDVDGSSFVSINVENQDRVLQSGDGNFRINFKK